jgi:hypothetical protein
MAERDAMIDAVLNRKSSVTSGCRLVRTVNVWLTEIAGTLWTVQKWRLTQVRVIRVVSMHMEVPGARKRAVLGSVPGVVATNSV